MSQTSGKKPPKGLFASALHSLGVLFKTAPDPEQAAAEFWTEKVRAFGYLILWVSVMTLFLYGLIYT